MKKIFSLILILIAFKGYSQYNPSVHNPVTNKAVGIAQSNPTDARTYFYDGTNFVYRAYVDTTEVWTYLNLAKYRTGQFDIVVNTGGTLLNGVITGGTNRIWYYKDGTARTNLVPKVPIVSVNGQTEGALVVKNADSIKNRLVDTTLTSTKQAGYLGYDSVNHIWKIYPAPTSSTGVGSVSVTSPLLNVGTTDDPNIAIPNAAADGSTKGASAYTASDFNAASGIISIDYPNGQAASSTLKGFLTSANWNTFNNKPNTVNGQTGTVITLNADSLKGLVVDTSSRRHLWVLAFDSLNHIWTLVENDTSSGGGSGSGTVTNVSRTNGYGISASVASPTTTPNITIAVDTTTGIRTTNYYNTLYQPRDVITGLVTSGTNVTITGSGTIGSPYVVNSSGSSNTNIGSGTRLAVDGTNNIKKIGTPASIKTDSTTTSNTIALLLDGDEAIPNRWEFYGTNLRDSSKGFREIEENFFGKIYDSTTWNNLLSFNNRDNGFSVVSNKILADAGSPGTFTNTLDLKSSTKLNKWVYSIKIKAGVIDASNFGLGIGVRSNNDYGAYGFCGRIDLGTGSIQGQVRLNLGSSYAEAAASTGGFSISTNDYVLLTVELDNYTATVKARNLTTNSGYVTASYEYVTSAGADPYFANTGNFSIFRFGGSNTIDSISITSNDPKNARIMIIGDSKTQGYDVTDFGYRFGDLLNNVFRSTVIHAGGSDRTKEVSRAMPEILALRPQQVLMNIGSNDLRQGAESNPVIFARYDSITTALIAAGIDVYHIVMYETAANLAPLVAHIQANYASKYIDVYNAMAAYPVATTLYADGVHPIDSGNIIAKNVIVNSYKVYGGSDRFTSGGTKRSISGVGTLNTIPIFTGTSEIGNSPITVTPSTRINLALPQEQIGTSPDYIWNKTNGSSNQKIWTWYGANDGKLDLRLVDDARSTVVSMLEFSRSGTTATRIDFKVPDSRFLGAAKIGTTINPTEEPVAIGLLNATHFPYISMYNSFAGTDVKVYDQYVADDGVLHYRLLNDAVSGGGDWMSVSRTGTSAADVAFPLVQSATDTTTYKPFGISSSGVTKRMGAWYGSGGGSGGSDSLNVFNYGADSAFGLLVVNPSRDTLFSRPLTQGIGIAFAYLADSSLKISVDTTTANLATKAWVLGQGFGTGGSGVTTMANIGGTSNADGASISGSTLTLQPASGSFGGVMTTGTQTLAGGKTWSSGAIFSSTTAFSGTMTLPGSFSSIATTNSSARMKLQGGNGNALFNIGGVGNTNFSNNGVGGSIMSLGSASGDINDFTTANSGTVTHTSVVGIDAQPISATGTSVTYTNASTLYLAGSPTASTNLTITNPWGIYIAGTGRSKILGTLQVDGGVSTSGADVITSGSSSTATGNPNVYFDPASLLATYTLTLPASPVDGQPILIHFGGTVVGAATVVTTLTISPNSGQTLVQSTTPTTAVGGDCIIYRYRSSNTSWYRER